MPEAESRQINLKNTAQIFSSDFHYSRLFTGEVDFFFHCLVYSPRFDTFVETMLLSETNL